jgi:putative peptidoglycan lipid II flippase
VAISLAAFPALSTAWAAGDRAGFGRLVRSSTVAIAVLTVVGTVVLVVVGPLAIDVLLGGGAFDAEDVALTASALAAFSLAVPFDALGHLFARGLYATHNTVLPVLASIAGFAVTIVVTLALVGSAGVVAIGLGFAAGSAVRASLQGAALARRMRTGAPPVSPADRGPEPAEPAAAA